MAERAIRYYVNVGGERIQLGHDDKLKEDPFAAVQASAEIDHYEAETTINDRKYTAVSTESMKDAAKRLEKKLPEGQ